MNEFTPKAGLPIGKLMRRRVAALLVGTSLKNM
jgi:hypothetical protein